MSNPNQNNPDFFVDFSDTELTIETDDTAASLEVPPLPYDMLFEKGKLLKENDLSIQTNLSFSAEKNGETEFLIVDDVYAESNLTVPDTDFVGGGFSQNTLEKNWEEPLDEPEEPEVLEWEMQESFAYENSENAELEELQIFDDEKDESQIEEIFVDSKEETPELSVKKEEEPIYAHWVDSPEEIKEALPVTDLILEDVLNMTKEETPAEEPEMLQLHTENIGEKKQEIRFYKGKYKIIIPVSEEEKNTYFAHLPAISGISPDSETDSVIERFLKNEPKLSLKNGEYVPPTVISAEEEDEEEIVTETMAKILVFQGKKQEAIKIYKRLSLEFPEKSSYFATLIEQLQ